MKRSEIIKLINEKVTGKLREAIRFYTYERGQDVDHDETDEDTYDELDALFDTVDLAEGWKARNLLIQCRKMLIDVGYYRVMPDSQIARTWVSSGTRWHFKMSGVAYTADHSQEVFMEGLK